MDWAEKSTESGRMENLADQAFGLIACQFRSRCDGLIIRIENFLMKM